MTISSGPSRRTTPSAPGSRTPRGAVRSGSRAAAEAARVTGTGGRLAPSRPRRRLEPLAVLEGALPPGARALALAAERGRLSPPPVRREVGDHPVGQRQRRRGAATGRIRKAAQQRLT